MQRMVHALLLRAERLRRQDRRQNARSRQNVRHRTHVLQRMRARHQRDRHRLHARPAQSDRDSRGVLRQKESPQQRELYREPARNRGHMEIVREMEEITEICQTVRQEARDREATARQEATEARTGAASIIAETAVRDARRETDAISEAQGRDRALREEIPAGMI